MKILFFIIVSIFNFSLIANEPAHQCSANGDPGCGVTCSDDQEAVCADGLMVCIGCAGDGVDLPGTGGVCYCKDIQPSNERLNISGELLKLVR